MEFLFTTCVLSLCLLFKINRLYKGQCFSSKHTGVVLSVLMDKQNKLSVLFSSLPLSFIPFLFTFFSGLFKLLMFIPCFKVFGQQRCVYHRSTVNVFVLNTTAVICTLTCKASYISTISNKLVLLLLTCFMLCFYCFKHWSHNIVLMCVRKVLKCFFVKSINHFPTYWIFSFSISVIG